MTLDDLRTGREPSMAEIAARWQAKESMRARGELDALDRLVAARWPAFDELAKKLDLRSSEVAAAAKRGELPTLIRRLSSDPVRRHRSLHLWA